MVIGTAFTAVVTAFVKDLLSPLIAATLGKPDFAGVGFTLHRTHFPVGDFVNAVIAFALDALVIYYAVVLPVQLISQRFRGPAAAPTTKLCPECLSEIPRDALRCKYCTALQPLPAA